MVRYYYHYPIDFIQPVVIWQEYKMACGLLKADCESKQQQRIALCVR